MSPLQGWNRCVKAILFGEARDRQLAAWDHLAEAYGVPAGYVRLTETETEFKYDDYAQGTGRSSLVPAYSIAEAREMGGH